MSLRNPLVSKTEIQKMQRRILAAVNDRELRQQVRNDYLYTLKKNGVKKSEAENIVDTILREFESKKPLRTVEKIIHQFLKSKYITRKDGKRVHFLDTVRKIREGRASKILQQIDKYLEEITGQIIDFGAGDGRLAQKIHDELEKNIIGVEVTEYEVPVGRTVPIIMFNGRKVDAKPNTFDAALCISVLHHDPDNAKALKELHRIVKGRVIIIETVPEGNSPKEIARDKERVFMNDYFSNRIIHGALCDADIPVPGTFETPKGWIARLKKAGYKVIASKDLGYDQPTIPERHHLLVAEKV